MTRKQKTTRPDEIPPELWKGMSVKQRAEAIAESLKASCDPKGGAEAASSSSPAAAAWTLREADGDDRYPRMPVMAAVVQEHREHEPDRPIWLEACVARPVGKAEISRTPAARAALEKEWQKLHKANTWDESTVMEWSEVAARAKTKGTKAHVGRIVEIMRGKKGVSSPQAMPAASTRAESCSRATRCATNRLTTQFSER